jgi:hypothetical protein
MAGVSGKDATLSYGDTTAPSSAIAQITSIGLPSQSVTDIDVTTMDSAGNVKEFEPGLLDNGEIPVELRYKKANASTINGLVGVAGKYYKIALPAETGGTTASITFGGYIKATGGAVPIDDTINQQFTIKVSGPITWA